MSQVADLVAQQLVLVQPLAEPLAEPIIQSVPRPIAQIAQPIAQAVGAEPAQLLPARELMAFTLTMHILLVPFGVALPFLTLLMNYRALRSRDPVALQLARRWSAVMAVQFAVGIVTGTVLSLEFGLLWPGLMGRWGDVFGIGFGIEAWAFFLEAVFIAIYLYGWRRMRPWPHFLVGLPLPAAALLGAFGIIAANSWMNTPHGFTLDAAGRPVDVDVRQVLFTPIFGPEYWHFMVAMYMTAGFVVAGVYARGWLRGRRDRYHRLGFLVPFTVAAALVPVQIFLGDFIARAVFHQQPIKFAAMELVWETDTHVPEYIGGWLNEDGTVSGSIPIPSLDSILVGFTPDTEVTGLTSVPASDRPSTTEASITHLTFDLMVGIGFFLLLLATWFGWAWLRRRDLPSSRWFFRLATVAGAASAVAVVAGWVTTEVGRQPWIVYENMRVAEAVTATGPELLWLMFGVVVIVYALVFTGLLAVLLRLRTRWRMADAGPAEPTGGRAAEVPAVGFGGLPDGIPGQAPEAAAPYGPRIDPVAPEPPLGEPYPDVEYAHPDQAERNRAGRNRADGR